MSIAEKALGPDHPDVGADLDHLVSMYLRQGRSIAEIQPLLKRADHIRMLSTERELKAAEKTIGTGSSRLWVNFVILAAFICLKGVMKRPRHL